MPEGEFQRAEQEAVGVVVRFGGAVVGTIDVTRTPAAYYAPHTSNVTFYFPVTTQGETLNIESTEVTFVRGRVEQDVTLVSVQTPFPTALARRLTTVADGRL